MHLQLNVFVSQSCDAMMMNELWYLIMTFVINALILQLTVFLSQSCDAMMTN